MGLICFVHGDPYHRGCDSDAWVDKMLDRFGQRAEDTLDTGVLARMAKSLVGHLKGIVGPSRSSSGQSRWSHNWGPSYVSERGSAAR